MILLLMAILFVLESARVIGVDGVITALIGILIGLIIGREICR